MSSVIGIGETYWDNLAIVKQFPAENSESFTEDFEECGGGNCGNALTALSRLGVHSSIIARIGTDETGKRIKQSLTDEGVDTSYLEKKIGFSPFSYVIVSKEGHSRTGIIRLDSFHYDEFDVSPTIVDDFDALLIGGRYQKTEHALAARARELRIPVFLEAEHKYTFSEAILDSVDVVITSKEFQDEYFGNQDYVHNLDLFLDKGVSHAITTLGDEGSVLKNRNGSEKVNAAKTEVIDTTGAGDAYFAGVVFGYLRKWDIKKCMQFASNIAAMKCKKIGARTGLPFLDDVKHLF